MAIFHSYVKLPEGINQLGYLGAPTISQPFQDPDSSVREAAAKALGCLGHDGLRAMDGEDVQAPGLFSRADHNFFGWIM